MQFEPVQGAGGGTEGCERWRRDHRDGAGESGHHGVMIEIRRVARRFIAVCARSDDRGNIAECDAVRAGARESDGVVDRRREHNADQAKCGTTRRTNCRAAGAGCRHQNSRHFRSSHTRNMPRPDCTASMIQKPCAWSESGMSRKFMPHMPLTTTNGTLSVAITLSPFVT